MARSDWRRPALESLKEGERRIKMTVSYDGSEYQGWQIQQNGTTIQQVLEEALETMLGFHVDVIGSGRTDSKVHAIGQVCHFDLCSSRIPAKAFKPRLNALLPPSIRIQDSCETDGTFHARFTAMARTYRFFIKRTEDMTAFDYHRVWSIHDFPDKGLLDSYAKMIGGTHDFTTFCSSHDECESKVRDIYESYWRLEKDSFSCDMLTYTITGNAFLYRMVRSLVGSMVQYAEGGRSPEDFQKILLSRERSLSGRTASPWGLYLLRISYDPDEYQWFEEQANERD
ncbi:MAG: tRNA pseudouridine(38-40) synthase TruA [Sphaerochaetaceae bacterium]